MIQKTMNLRILILPVLIFLFILVSDSQISALNQVHKCDNCHQMHGVSGGQPLLPEIDAENTCLTCHSPGGASSVVATNHVSYTCLDCHDPHDNMENWLGGTNIKLVLPQVGGSDGTLRPVVFESRGTSVGDPVLHSFCDNDADKNGVYDAVCDTCHMGTNQHVGYPVPVKHKHQTGVTCTNNSACHPHMTGFD
jgi:hypothetical protein